MEQRPLEYTVKIYCEGFTEWYYFEWLRTNNRFKFSMEPDIPKNSRSSYKQNLKLIDKELRKNPQERADAIFLVIDTDTLVKNKAQYAIYQEAKEKYKSKELFSSRVTLASKFGFFITSWISLPEPTSRHMRLCVLPLKMSCQNTRRRLAIIRKIAYSVRAY